MFRSIKLSRSNWCAIVVFLMSLFIWGLWTADVAVAAMNTGGTMVSLLWEFDPVAAYHLGLVVSITSGFALALICIHHIVRD